MVSWSHADAPADRKLTSQVDEILKEWSMLKPGMTRSELSKNFSPELGGLFAISDMRYCSKHCPYIKVDVKFTLTQPNQKTELPTDVIQTISKPYLEYAISD